MNRFFIPCATVCVLLAVSAASGQQCCDHCGCQAHCRKVCRVICETKTVPEVTYTCECEDFCVPGPSVRCGTKCDCGADGQACEHCREKPNYVPGCATVHTRKKLVKHVTQKQVASYKWVVEHLCDGCAERCQREAASAAAKSSPAQTPNGTDPLVVNASAISPTSEPASPIKRIMLPLFGK